MKRLNFGAQKKILNVASDQKRPLLRKLDELSRAILKCSVAESILIGFENHKIDWKLNTKELIEPRLRAIPVSSQSVEREAEERKTAV